MFNYLKKILFSLLILMIPYMNSVSNAMDAEINDESRSNLTCRRVVKDDQNSWTSSVVKGTYNVVKLPYDVMNFAIRKPAAAMVLVGFWVLPAAAAVVEAVAGNGCACYCGVQPKFYGCQWDSGRCADFCSKSKLPNPQCFVGDKGC